MKNTRIIEARTDSEFAAARSLFKAYAAEIALDLCFQGFTNEMELLLVNAVGKGILPEKWSER